MNQAKKIIHLKDYKKPEVPGLHYRLLCLSGKHKGESFYLSGGRVVIGRGEECDITLLDVKASREHAEIVKFGDKFAITDLGSQNGVFIGDKKIKQHALKKNDKIVIGQTVFKFDQVNIDETVVGVIKPKATDEDEEEELEPPKKKNKLFILLMVIIIGVVLLGEDSGSNKKVKRKKRKERTYRNITNIFMEADKIKRSQEDKEIRKKLDVIFQRGLREAREGNYFRAISEFNLALILSPGNGRAKYFLDKTKDLLDKEIDKNFVKAQKDVQGLKYKEATISYCNIMNLLQDYTDDERYKAARENLNIVEEKVGVDKGEIKCSEK